MGLVSRFEAGKRYFQATVLDLRKGGNSPIVGDCFDTSIEAQNDGASIKSYRRQLDPCLSPSDLEVLVFEWECLEVSTKGKCTYSRGNKV
jgi:hypothetical protein